MNELSLEKTMTIKEVSEVLKKDESTIRKIGKSLFPEIFENGKKTILNESQITSIKLNLGKNSELPKTNLEKKLLVAQAWQILNEEIEYLKKENNAMKPKALFYDAVTGTRDTIDMKEVAKVLNFGIGRNKLFQFLREQKILDTKNQPYQKYVDSGYFKLIEISYQVNGETHIQIKPVVFQKGVEYIQKRYERIKTKEVLKWVKIKNIII